MSTKRFVSVAIIWLIVSTLFFSYVTSPVYALDDANDWDQQVDANGTITLTEGTIVIEGSNDPLPGQPWVNTVTGITTSSSLGETVSFSWSFITTDNAYYDRPQVLLADIWTDLANNSLSPCLIISFDEYFNPTESK